MSWILMTTIIGAGLLLLLIGVIRPADDTPDNREP